MSDTTIIKGRYIISGLLYGAFSFLFKDIIFSKMFLLILSNHIDAYCLVIFYLFCCRLRGCAVARWRGGAVARWRGGAVAQWLNRGRAVGDSVERVPYATTNPTNRVASASRRPPQWAPLPLQPRCTITNTLHNHQPVLNILNII